MAMVTVGELKELLEDYDDSLAVTVFAEGHTFPITGVYLLSGDYNIPFDSVELECGRIPCDQDEDEDEWEDE